MGTRQTLKAIGIGIVATLALLALSVLARATEQPSLASALLWQSTWLQSLIPPLNIGTTKHPVYEGTPLNILAFFASIPWGFVVYGIAAYLWLRVRRRRT